MQLPDFACTAASGGFGSQFDQSVRLATSDGGKLRFPTLVLVPAAMCTNGLIRHIARPTLDAVVHADLADRAQRLIVKRRHAKGSPQLFIELPQIGQV